MSISPQTIFFVIGVEGLVLAVLFAVAAVIYFFRVDIRSVRADLSGKARIDGLAQYADAKTPRGTRVSLTREGGWQGDVSQGRLSSAESDSLGVTGTGTDSAALSESGDSWGSSWSEPANKLLTCVVAAGTDQVVGAGGKGLETSGCITHLLVPTKQDGNEEVRG